jgi:hypothetical protein
MLSTSRASPARLENVIVIAFVSTVHRSIPS